MLSCCNMVGEPGGIEVWTLRPYLPSVLWQCWVIWPMQLVSDNVFGGTLKGVEFDSSEYVLSLPYVVSVASQQLWKEKESNQLMLQRQQSLAVQMNTFLKSNSSVTTLVSKCGICLAVVNFKPLTHLAYYSFTRQRSIELKICQIRPAVFQLVSWVLVNNNTVFMLEPSLGMLQPFIFWNR